MLELTVISESGRRPLQFAPNRMVNAGYVGRDLAATKAHIEELAKEGIPPPASIPMLFPIIRDTLKTADQIEVVTERTSGEAEFVLLLIGEAIYVGVGSDHTDRQLETQDILLSKQICPNVMSTEIWDYRDVQDHWDEMILESWVTPALGESEVLYQQAPLSTILSAEDIIDLVKSRLTDGECENMVIYSGTFPTVSGKMIYGNRFRCVLTDPILNRTLNCEYEIVRLDYLG